MAAPPESATRENRLTRRWPRQFRSVQPQPSSVSFGSFSLAARSHTSVLSTQPPRFPRCLANRLSDIRAECVCPPLKEPTTTAIDAPLNHQLSLPTTAPGRIYPATFGAYCNPASVNQYSKVFAGTAAERWPIQWSRRCATRKLKICDRATKLRSNTHTRVYIYCC